MLQRRKGDKDANKEFEHNFEEVSHFSLLNEVPEGIPEFDVMGEAAIANLQLSKLSRINNTIVEHETLVIQTATEVDEFDVTARFDFNNNINGKEMDVEIIRAIISVYKKGIMN